MPKTGIDAIGDAPWGTHLCLLYRNPQELTEILVPYFKTGLENNEVCMWILSPPLTKENVESALREAVPDFDRYQKQKQVAILPHTEWYHQENALDLRMALNGWLEKIEQALALGFEGLRVAGDSSWVEKENWEALIDYEAAVNDADRDAPFPFSMHVSAGKMHGVRNSGRSSQSRVFPCPE